MISWWFENDWGNEQKKGGVWRWWVCVDAYASLSVSLSIALTIKVEEKEGEGKGSLRITKEDRKRDSGLYIYDGSCK